MNWSDYSTVFYFSRYRKLPNVTRTFLKEYPSILDYANAHIDIDKEEVIYLCIWYKILFWRIKGNWLISKYENNKKKYEILFP
jgi:hypothetical protein